jgi:ABC-2 type transport system permease protein
MTTIAEAPGFKPADRMRRINAILLRHLYLMRSSWLRLFELAYWPLMQMILWGFINDFLATQSNWVFRAGGVLIGGILLWDVLVRGQFGLTLSLLEEMWSRNFANLFVSPLRPGEYAAALMIMSVIRSLLGVLPAALIAIPLFHYSVFALGLPLLAFYVVLMMTGWAVGLMISAALIRFGLAAESFAWAAIFLLSPLAGVFYPVTILPEWLQAIAWAIPPTYVFEGMRTIMLENTFRLDLIVKAVALNVVYLAIGLTLFMLAFREARVRGQLLQSGE